MALYVVQDVRRADRDLTMTVEYSELRSQVDSAIDRSIRTLSLAGEGNYELLLGELRSLQRSVDDLRDEDSRQELSEDILSSIASLAIAAGDYALATDLTKDLAANFRPRTAAIHVSLMLRVRALHATKCHAAEVDSLLALADADAIDDEFCALVAARIVRWHPGDTERLVRLVPRFQACADSKSSLGGDSRIRFTGSSASLSEDLIRLERELQSIGDV